MLIGRIAAATRRRPSRGRRGAAGHTTAVAVVESFGMLEAFHPGRIDLGVGRSGQRRSEAIEDGREPSRRAQAADGMARRRQHHRIAAFDMSTLMRNPRLRAEISVLRRPEAVSPDFGEQVTDVLAMLDGSYAASTTSTRTRCRVKGPG